MTLDAIAAAAGIALPDPCAASVTGFAIDNRKVAPGTVFGAFQGSQVNGEDFIPAAIKAGAIAIVARPQAEVSGAIHIVSEEPRQTFAQPGGTILYACSGDDCRRHRYQRQNIYC